MASRSASSRRLKHLEVALPEAFRGLFRPFRYKAFYGGRGSGKSHAMATALVLLAAQRPLRILAARETQRSIRESSKRLLDDRIAALGLGHRFVSTEHEIRGRSGASIVFAGLGHPDAIKSMEGIDIAWVEEADTVSQRSLDVLVPTIRRPASELWFAWNPRHPTDPVDALFRSGVPRADALVRRVTHADNPWFPAVLEAERQWDLRRDPDKYAHVWDGGYQRQSQARVFRNWRIESLTPPPDARPYFGADWGFAQDPTVLVRCLLVADRVLYVDREAYRIGCTIDETPALFAAVEGAHGPGAWPITADSARPELIAHMRSRGFRIKAARKGGGSVEEGVEFLRALDIVVHPDCRHTIDELTHYAYVVDRLTGDVLPKLDDRHNHVIDALRYALEEVRRADYQLLARL